MFAYRCTLTLFFCCTSSQSHSGNEDLTGSNEDITGVFLGVCVRTLMSVYYPHLKNTLKVYLKLCIYLKLFCVLLNPGLYECLLVQKHLKCTGSINYYMVESSL